MCQKDPKQGFIARSTAAQVTQPHEAGRNGDLLLYHLRAKKADWIWSGVTGRRGCFPVLETHQRRQFKGICGCQGKTLREAVWPRVSNFALSLHGDKMSKQPWRLLSFFPPARNDCEKNNFSFSTVFQKLLRKSWERSHCWMSSISVLWAPLRGLFLIHTHTKSCLVC